MKTPLEIAIDKADGQAPLARAVKILRPDIKITQAQIWKWLNTAKGPTPPAEFVIPICEALDWEMTPHKLRPDLYPNPTDALPAGLELDRRAEERRIRDRRVADQSAD